ncbi:MAG: ferrochelatase [Acidobacteria bacterium]|nr:MAG: ferrochelatase [Acidobacteriota bacterium]
MSYDSILIVSFGGPEGRDDVLPFLENVLCGRNVPRERMLAVAEHYYLFGGVSPINEANRRLIAALRNELESSGPHLPVYWGNRNWHPLLADTLRQMSDDGVRRALAFVTAGYSSYSSCRQYLENIEAARESVGEGAPRVDKLRVFFKHPRFIEANAANVQAAMNRIPRDRRASVQLVFTAHSIPVSMAQNCRYESQLNEASRLVARALNHPQWQLAFQSRSGPPNQSWLGPDIMDVLRTLRESSTEDVVLAPIGFVSEHMEVVYDLDVQAKQLSDELGLNLVRAQTADSHHAFVQMIRELVVERMNGGGIDDTPGQDCGSNCCLPSEFRN